MVNFPPPVPPVEPGKQAVVRQYNMLNQRQFPIPSPHQLVSDAYVTLGAELERLRCLEMDDTVERTSKERCAVYKESLLKAEALGKLVRTLQALRQEEHAIAAQVAGKSVDELSDADVLDMLAKQQRVAPTASTPQVQGAPQWYKPEAVQPLAYKRQRGPVGHRDE